MSGILWYVSYVFISNITNSFKEGIQQELEEEVRVTGKRNFQTNSIHLINMIREVYLAWPIRDEIQILLSCTDSSCWIADD